MAKPEKGSVDRRDFLKGAVVGTASLLAPAGVAEAAAAGMAAPEPAPPAPAEAQTLDRSGSDFMIDVIKSLGIEYMFANPGNTFRAFHESLINYGGNKDPELITCMHEEAAAAMCHGYAKIEGKPAAMICHGTVGLQHAAMAIYQAYADRTPMFLIDANKSVLSRGNGTDWEHASADPGLFVREMTKWDDNPQSLQLFAESAVRAYKISMTPPTMPVCVVADFGLQEKPIAESNLTIPRLILSSPPVGDSGAVAEAARLLVQAENPVIITDRGARSQAGMDLIVELAELLQAPVIDRYARMNFPTQHPLNHSYTARPVISSADVILALEVLDLAGTLSVASGRNNGDPVFRPATKPGAKVIAINSDTLFSKTVYQTMHRYADVDLPIAADAHATLPSLVEAVKNQLPAGRKSSSQERGAKLAAARQRFLDQTLAMEANGWDDVPISTGRMTAELNAAIKGTDWSLVSRMLHENNFALKLWKFDKYYQYIGGPAGGGEGYGAPAAVGAALANKKYGRISVNVQCDGDLMYCPGVLWTAAHHRIPLLTVMHNNRAYHEEVMQVQLMCNRKNRGVDRAKIGTAIEDPNLDFSKIAAGMGMYAEGPITDPKDLGPALRRAVDVVKKGEPALVDVIMQGR